MKITQWQLNEVKKQLDKSLLPVIEELVKIIDAKINNIKKPTYITPGNAFRDMCFGNFSRPSEKRLSTKHTDRYWPNKNIGPSMDLPALTVDVMKFTGAQKKNEKKAQAYFEKCEKIRHHSKEANRITGLEEAKEQVLVNIALRGVDGASEAIEAFQNLCASA